MLRTSGFRSALQYFRLVIYSVVICALIFSHRSTSAFDTFWHSSMNGEIGHAFGFSADATKTLQFSSFASDYFGPIFSMLEGTIEKALSYIEFRNLPST